MPEPLFTELELTDMCSQNAVNLNIKDTKVNLSFNLNKFVHLEEKSIHNSNKKNKIELNKNEIELNKNKNSFDSIINKKKTDIIELNELNQNQDSNNLIINKIKNNLKENKSDLNKLINESNIQLTNNNFISNNLLNNSLNTIKNPNNLDKKENLKKIINNSLNQKKKSLNNENQQFSFEQQTDNLVEEMYFIDELSDQKVKKELSSNSINQLNELDLNKSITKIQLNETKPIKYSLNINLDESSGESENFDLDEKLSSEDDQSNKLIKLDFETNDNSQQVVTDDLCKSSVKSIDSGTSSCSAGFYNHDYLVVVAIDFGTTYSGYAFSFVREPEQTIHMMRTNLEHQNLINHKTPTSLLLTPNGNFHSFGYLAKETYHNLNTEEATKWLYFDKFKMSLHRLEGQELSKHTKIKAANGTQITALTVFSMTLRYFRELASEQLEQQCGSKINLDSIRWVVTVPAIWKQQAKQFMRFAAYQAGLATEKKPNQLLIVLEPEAASIYCRRLRLNQLIKPEIESNLNNNCTLDLKDSNKVANKNILLENCFIKGTRYLVVDCGGGTVDTTVHEIQDSRGQLREIYKGTGGPFGSIEVDKKFELTLMHIFGQEFIDNYKNKYPSGFVDLMASFEARKRTATICQDQLGQTLNITLPFSFINAFKKQKNGSIDQYVKRYYTNNKDILKKDEISYCSKLGMIRLQPSFMCKLFKPVTNEILNHLANIICNKEVNNKKNPLKYLFLVGGFAESQILQQVIRNKFNKLNLQINSNSNYNFYLDKQESKDKTKLNNLSKSSKESTLKRSLAKFLKNDNSNTNIILNKQKLDNKKVNLTKICETNFDSNIKIIIPQEVSSTILRGAVLYGLDPTVITVRRSRLTYGIGVLNRFQPDIHPKSKLIVRNNISWCTDVFDKFVVCDQSIALGECVQRSYTPAKQNQKYTVLHIYCSESDNAQFVTDPCIIKCGSLILNLEPFCDNENNENESLKSKCVDEIEKKTNEENTREILTKMIFGDTEIKVTAIDIKTGKSVKAEINFLSN